ncbi:hypothetical protein ACWC9T_13265 [Kitasatospora sp. NPDC001159]
MGILAQWEVRGRTGWAGRAANCCQFHQRLRRLSRTVSRRTGPDRRTGRQPSKRWLRANDQRNKVHHRIANLRGVTDEQRLRRVFTAALADALAGNGVPTCLGLDAETEDALWVVYDAHPRAPEELVAPARLAFERQLDGANAARQRERIARWFAGRGDGREGG